MNFYETHILPHILNFAMKQDDMTRRRARLIPEAEGRVLEIGCGSGHNMAHYSARATELIAIEPSPKLREMTLRAAKNANRAIDLRDAGAEAIPLDDASIDTVVTTWTLCTIADAHTALAEMRRVLKPSGRLLFAEHGRAPDEAVRKWQNRLNPAWRVIGGGCNLNRAIEELIGSAGFEIEKLDMAYEEKAPKFAGFMYEGSARRG